MKTVQIELARAIWLFDVQQLNPTGISMTAPLTEFVSKYQFKKYPKHVLDYNDKGGLQFEEGEFASREGRTISVTFTFYNDGLVADTRSSTTDANDFLLDATQWLRAQFKLTPPSDYRCVFISRVVVHMDRKLSGFNPKISALEEKLSVLVPGGDGKPRRFALGAVGLLPTDFGLAGAPAGFRIEYKVGHPFEKNYYLAEAPLRTEDHLELLKEFEALLA